jgi:hypothetical protein
MNASLLYIFIDHNCENLKRCKKNKNKNKNTLLHKKFAIEETNKGERERERERLLKNWNSS